MSNGMIAGTAGLNDNKREMTSLRAYPVIWQDIGGYIQ
jgi:hypothetical protein